MHIDVKTIYSIQKKDGDSFLSGFHKKKDWFNKEKNRIAILFEHF